ncbi:hypothetical protein, partial [Limnospira sp. PMC 1243.20]|uniref:hypothetical protein n=1 Tax=Limnospira sp. PMC 1243.20 TaxID=2981041 RepID=UPI0028E12F65
DGSTDLQVLNTTANSLAVGESGLVNMSIRILSPGSYNNQVTTFGTSTDGVTIVTDFSMDGPEPAPNDPDPTNPLNNDPTPLDFNVNPVIGIA